MTSAAELAGALFASPLLLLLTALLAIASNELFFHFLRRMGALSAHRSIASAIARRCWWPGRFLLPAVACDVALPFARLDPAQFDLVDHALVLVIIGASAWMIVALSFALEDTATARFRIDVRENLTARRVRTRVGVVRRITVGLVTLLALAAMLITFQGAQALGASLLASAGIIGIIVGVAARPTISNVIAGLEIFFSEPLRIEDVVVIEGEWGRVEDIRLTHIVLRLWDDRRLIVPLLYILDHPFQNWTRHSAHVLATAFVWVDYSTAIDQVRGELHRILEHSELWDRRYWNLQVTELEREGVQIRALMTAADAGAAWDLRCEVREKLLSFMQIEQPDALPRRRVELAGGEAQHKANGLKGGISVG